MGLPNKCAFCIYCLQDKPTEKFKKREHVLPQRATILKTKVGALRNRNKCNML